MGKLEVNEALGDLETIKPIDIEIVILNKLSPEIIKEIDRTVKSWNPSS